MKIGIQDIDSLDFAKGDGLLPVIVQDVERGAVLMLGYMNRDALRETLVRGRVVFFSRSKQRLWEKGETSGHTLQFVSASADCDRDTLLVQARPVGPACHLGTTTCFGNEPQSRAERLSFLGTLEDVIERRIASDASESYTVKLFREGTRRIAQKVGEEGVEVALAASAGEDAEVVTESADLLYHLTLLLRARGLGLEQVADELAARHKTRTAAPSAEA
jgi:phosphoribosyl-ATP pyrophosphohydrolase/phosphoribosyl-AMP cyclohydrolase